MLCRSALPLILLCLALPATAKASDHPAHITTYGPTPTPSCGAWTRERERRSQTYQVYAFWVLGMFTGANIYHPFARGDLGAGTDSNGLLAWVDLHCRSHPLETVVGAALILMRELEGRRPAQPPP